jgi:SAM-dependent methyltransferase/uncharacterized protein YbaR (Trm112 family)
MQGVPLRLAHVAREESGHIIEGVLHCSNPQCLREYPIVDGIPLIVRNIRQYVADNMLAIYGRRDLGECIETMLGDACGPASGFEVIRQQLSSYCWDHYADFDQSEVMEEPRPGSVARILKAGLELVGAIPNGPILDVGCSVGRGTFTLAEGVDQLVLGVDLHFPMLRLASDILRRGRVRYDRRRVGLVYDRREFTASFESSTRVDYWACDAAALPLATGAFSLAVGLNVLDCVYSPIELLNSISRILKPGGKVLLACPYDWSAGATPFEAWLGGHSQRSPMKGSSIDVLGSLLTPGAHPSSIAELKRITERDGVSWHVRLHDRSTMIYKVHLVVAQRLPTVLAPSSSADEPKLQNP